MKPPGCVHSEFMHGTKLRAWRWYYPERALRWASANGERFHRWILKLKDGGTTAVDLFAGYLAELWEEPLNLPDGLIVIPPATRFEDAPDFGLHRLGKCAEEHGCGKYLEHYLRRHTTLPQAVVDPKVRDVQIQKHSLRLDGVLDESIESAVVVDDVTTSGATIWGAICLLREVNPKVQFSAFAFGKTQRTGSKPFPETPAFPYPWGRL